MLRTPRIGAIESNTHPTPVHWSSSCENPSNLAASPGSRRDSRALAAQDGNAPTPEPAHIIGTVTDVNGDTLPGATVILQGPGLKDPPKVLSDDNGFFEFKQVDSGTYRITITAPDFAD